MYNLRSKKEKRWAWAPLHYVLKPWTQHNEDISAYVQMILNAGAHMNQLNSYGQTPLDFGKSCQLNLNQEH